jgi:hypothetical protein
MTISLKPTFIIVNNDYLFNKILFFYCFLSGPMYMHFYLYDTSKATTNYVIGF